MLVRAASRTGAPILLFDGKPLHSTYDPVREATRFARATLAGALAVPTIILVGAVLDYIEDAILAQAPRARVLSIALSSEIAPLRTDRSAAPRWQPASEASLSSFLAEGIDESDLAGLRVVEWTPALAAWPDEARSAHVAIRAFVERLKASYATTAAFGPLWLRNALANFVALPAVAPLPPAGEGEVLCIAASGPTLEDALPSLLEHRRRLRLWALPSSARALAHAGLCPDLVVLTDPGLYALQHLPPAYGVPIAMPLAASRGSWRFADTVLLFVQPCSFEKELAGLAAPWPMPVIPPQGTVAASALQLAAAAGYRTIVFAGLDFCYRDVIPHARPDLLEIYNGARASRLMPSDGALYGQAAEATERGDSGSRATAGLRAYAQWFANAALPAGTCVHRLLPSAVEVPWMAPLDPGGLPALLPRVPVTPSAAHGVLPRPDRAALARGALARWGAEVRDARGRPITLWPAMARELSLFLDLPSYARARAGGGCADETLDAVAARLDRLRARLEDRHP